MIENDVLAARFEEDRPHLQAVAYRMLGSLAEAEDAVQEAWLNVSRAGTDGVQNLTGWLTTITARVCLDMLRSRRSRREDPLGAQLPEPVEEVDPEREAVLADSVGLAMLVVLDMLAPAERVAFVLHDMFAVPFEEIAVMVGRSPAATRQLASRARRRVHGTGTGTGTGTGSGPRAVVGRGREVVEAFLAAARGGDVAALVAVLDPEVVLRVDSAADGAGREVRGAAAVAGQASTFATRHVFARPALVDGKAGFVVAPLGRLQVAFAFTIADGSIVGIDVVTDPQRLREVDVAVID